MEFWWVVIVIGFIIYCRKRGLDGVLSDLNLDDKPDMIKVRGENGDVINVDMKTLNWPDKMAAKRNSVK